MADDLRDVRASSTGFSGGSNPINLVAVCSFPPSLKATPTQSTSPVTSLDGSYPPTSVRFDGRAPHEVDTIDAVRAAIVRINPILRPSRSF